MTNFHQYVKYLLSVSCMSEISLHSCHCFDRILKCMWHWLVTELLVHLFQCFALCLRREDYIAGRSENVKCKEEAEKPKAQIRKRNRNTARNVSLNTSW